MNWEELKIKVREDPFFTDFNIFDYVGENV